jgi:hypothetical protein
MRNYLVLIFLIFMTACPSSCYDVKEIDFYVYYVQSKNILICSDKKEAKGGPILNEFENDKGFTCLLNLKKKLPFYLINIHISRVEEKNIQSFEIDLDIGQFLLFKNLTKLPTVKNFYLKLDEKSNKLFVVEKCDLNNFNNCLFQEAKDSIFMDKFVKLNFSTRQKDLTLNLLEKTSILRKDDIKLKLGMGLMTAILLATTGYVMTEIACVNKDTWA